MTDLTQWVAQSGNGATGTPRPPTAPRALNEKAVSFLLALGAIPEPDAATQQGMALLLKTVKSDQVEEGSWQAWPETRPPIFGDSSQRATASAALALLPAVAGGDDEAKVARDRAVEWLSATPSDDDSQSIAMRLILWCRLGQDSKECEPLVQHIEQRQNVDGGWGQTDAMASDAWATGQALYALAHVGVKAGDPRVDRAQAFLIKTQRDDGSWPMISRPTKPGGAGSTSLIPITGAGSSWAVLGLVRSR
jgi:hypothetical protein